MYRQGVESESDRSCEIVCAKIHAIEIESDESAEETQHRFMAFFGLVVAPVNAFDQLSQIVQELS